MGTSPLDTLFATFLRERKYLQNLRPATLAWHRNVWTYFMRSATRSLIEPADLSASDVEHFVYSLRERGVKPVTCNTWLRSLNTVFRWMHERGDLPRRLHMKPLKVEKRLVPTLAPQDIQKLVSYRPPGQASPNPKHADGPRHGQKVFALWRIQALVCGLLDTGCRVQELLDTKVEDWDFDNLLVSVIGKGDKQRRIPFSVELRRILFRYVQERQRLGVTQFETLMFPEHAGGAWDQRNALRSFYILQRRLGIKRVGFHRLRHTFPTEYLRRGGDVVRLSRRLGHTQITTTMRYLHLLTEDRRACGHHHKQTRRRPSTRRGRAGGPEIALEEAEAAKPARPPRRARARKPPSTR